jgi:hypothetical protein
MEEIVEAAVSALHTSLIGLTETASRKRDNRMYRYKGSPYHPFVE